MLVTGMLREWKLLIYIKEIEWKNISKKRNDTKKEIIENDKKNKSNEWEWGKNEKRNKWQKWW